MGIVVLGLGFWGRREMASMEQKFSSPFYFLDPSSVTADLSYFVYFKYP